MSTQTDVHPNDAAAIPARYRLPLSDRPGLPDADAAGITEELIRDVVDEFYLRARQDPLLGPVFEARVHDWDRHLNRMHDFWSAALLRTGRYSGRPVEAHRPIPGLTAAHFRRWLALFEATVFDLCPLNHADAFLTRARRMRDGMISVLQLEDRSADIPA
ncbi:MAG: group III truncated hemoglobin [Isosphaeraceae bacterium]